MTEDQVEVRDDNVDQIDETVTDDDGTDEPTTDTAPEPDPYEQRARRMGWVPEDEWDADRAKEEGRRKPSHFLSAKEYVEKVESDLPVLRERNRFLDQEVKRFTTKLDDATRRIEEMGGLVKTLHEQNVKVGQRAYERARRELEAEMRQAVAEADVEKYEEKKQALEQLDQEHRAQQPVEQKGEDAPQQTQRAEPNPVVEQWIEDNKWFRTDHTLHQVAIVMHGDLLRSAPGLSLRDNLDRVADEIKRRFPEKFGNPARAAPGTVARPAPGKQRSNGRTFADLPQDARDAYEQLRQQFEQHGRQYTREQYLADYQWQ